MKEPVKPERYKAGGAEANIGLRLLNSNWNLKACSYEVLSSSSEVQATSSPNDIHCTLLPLYPGTDFPACPGGGVVEFPKPRQEAVIADPVSVM